MVDEAVDHGGYLKAEQRLGRLSDGTDITTLALALVGTVHHLLMTSWAGTQNPREQAERLVSLLVGSGPNGAAGTQDVP